jgi:hypothetical protein
MACKNCKEKKVNLQGQEKFEKRASFVDKYLGWFLLIWFLLGAYGLVTLIQKFL